MLNNKEHLLKKTLRLTKLRKESWLNRVKGHKRSKGYIGYPPVWHLIVIMLSGCIAYSILSLIIKDPAYLSNNKTVILPLLIFGLTAFFMTFGFVYALIYNNIKSYIEKKRDGNN